MLIRCGRLHDFQPEFAAQSQHFGVFRNQLLRPSQPSTSDVQLVAFECLDRFGDVAIEASQPILKALSQLDGFRSINQRHNFGCRLQPFQSRESFRFTQPGPFNVLLRIAFSSGLLKLTFELQAVLIQFAAAFGKSK